MPNSFTPQQVEEFLREFFDTVGTRQYIGARYVPIFGRAGESTMQWDGGLAPYEPLTIVTYQGDTYTSRTYVPAGIDITNAGYWAHTGQYNAQVEAYRREVIQLQEDWVEWKAQTLEDIDDEITGVKTVAVFIGNSYTQGVGATSQGMGMYNMLKHLFNEAYMFTTGGAGFGTYSGHTETFADLLQDAIDSTDFNNDLVTDIIFTSAMGDTRAVCAGESTVTNGIITAATMIASNFPKATMHVCYAEMVYGRDTQATYSEVYYMAQLRCDYIFRKFSENLGFNYMGWIGWNGNNVAGYNFTDNYHPNDAGYRLLKKKFLNAWFGGDVYDPKYFSVPVTDGSSTAMLHFTGYNPHHCNVQIDRVAKSLLPADIGQQQVLDIHCKIITPTYLPPFVPWIYRYKALSGLARFSAGNYYVFEAFVNSTIDTASDRVDDMYLRISFTDAITNNQTGTAFVCGVTDSSFHVNSSLTTFTLEG